jgi:transcriptional regulator with XRE-family HTH domain
MAGPRSHPQVEALLCALKQLFHVRGLRYRDVAERLGVTERTVKRWFSDHGLTMDVVEDLCGVVDMSFNELCDVAKSDLDARPQRLTREQEEQLFADLQLALVFMLLTRGWSSQEIQRECAIPEATLVGHLVRLEKIKLVELLPGNKVRVLFGRNIRWREHGEAGRAFARGLNNLFAGMDYSNPDAVWTTQVVNLSPQSLAELRTKFQKLIVEVLQASDADRRSHAENKVWHAILLAAHPFDPLKLETPSQSQMTMTTIAKSQRTPSS